MDGCFDGEWQDAESIHATNGEPQTGADAGGPCRGAEERWTYVSAERNATISRMNTVSPSEGEGDSAAASAAFLWPEPCLFGLDGWFGLILPAVRDCPIFARTVTLSDCSEAPSACVSKPIESS